MRTPLYNDELEDFLRQQADEHRMYPSDKLWRNIQLTMHGETRWPALTYISIFIIASLVVSTLLMKPEERMQKNVAAYANANTAGTPSEIAPADHTTATENSPVQHAYTDKITQSTIEAVNDNVFKEQLAVVNTPASQHYSENSNIALIHTKPAINPSAMAVAAKAPELTTSATTATINSNDESEEAATAGKPASMYFSTLGLMNFSGFKTNTVMHSAGNVDNEEIWRNYPLLYASDIIRKKLSKFSFQFYVTPSISYRQLTDAKGKATRSYTAIPLSANYKIDINNIVKHTPSVGAEVGFALGYKLNSRFTVKTGLQFNVRQYNIEAYPGALPPAPDVDVPDNSTVALDALAISANYTQNSSAPIILRNRYYEAAAPIGLDYKVFTGTNGAVSINVAATVQPTYTFDKEPFVITTDYKNYADGSSLMRNWNINSSVEAYVSYSIGPLRWQIGPQFRYQHLPTYGGGYPIHERLLDYGIKLGFTKSLR